MKKVVFVGLVVALGIGVGGLALAQFSGHGGGMMGPGYGGHMMGPGYGPNCSDNSPQATQLSPEQQKQLEQLRLKHWEETKGLRIELFSKHQELRGLYLQPTPDQKAIDKLQKETFNLEQRLREKDFAYDKEANRIAPQPQGSYGCGMGMHSRGPGWGGGCR